MGGDLKGISEALVVGPFCTGFSSASPHISVPNFRTRFPRRHSPPVRWCKTRQGRKGAPRTRSRENYNYITQHPARRRPTSGAAAQHGGARGSRFPYRSAAAGRGGGGNENI